MGAAMRKLDAAAKATASCVPSGGGLLAVRAVACRFQGRQLCRQRVAT